MNTKSLISITLGVFISCTMMIAPAKADVWNQQTKVHSVNQWRFQGEHCRQVPTGSSWQTAVPTETSCRFSVKTGRRCTLPYLLYRATDSTHPMIPC